MILKHRQFSKRFKIKLICLLYFNVLREAQMYTTHVHLYLFFNFPVGKHMKFSWSFILTVSLIFSVINGAYV